MNHRVHAFVAAIALFGAVLAVPTLAQDKMSGDKMGKMGHAKMAKGP